jgi:hypothetical protein
MFSSNSNEIPRCFPPCCGFLQLVVQHIWNSNVNDRNVVVDAGLFLLACRAPDSLADLQNQKWGTVRRAGNRDTTCAPLARPSEMAEMRILLVIFTVAGASVDIL